MVVTEHVLNLLLINKFEFNRLINECESRDVMFENMYSKFPIIINFNDIDYIKSELLNKEVDLDEFINIISKINLHIESE